MNTKGDYQIEEKRSASIFPSPPFNILRHFELQSGITNKGRMTIFSSPGKSLQIKHSCFCCPILASHPYGKKRVQKEQFFKREKPFLSSSHHLFFGLGLDQFLFSYRFTFKGVGITGE